MSLILKGLFFRVIWGHNTPATSLKDFWPVKKYVIRTVVKDANMIMPVCASGYDWGSCGSQSHPHEYYDGREHGNMLPRATF